MNKQEAITALAEGKTIKHASHYIFEDGCRCTHREFWQNRTEYWWNNGWSEY